MKYLIPLFLIIFFIGITFENTDATHLPRYSGGQYDDIFSYQEIDIGDGTDEVGRCEVHSYSAGFYIKVSESDSTQGNCAFFKSFDKEDVNLKDVNNAGTWTRQTGTQTYPSYKIYDGEYVAGNSTDFPDNGGIATKGMGKLYDSGTLGNGCGLGDCNPATINANLTAGTQPMVTIFFGYLYDSATDADTSYNSGSSITIEDLGTFNFCSGGPNSLCDNARPITTGGSGNNEYGYIRSYNNLPALGDSSADNFYNGTQGLITDLTIVAQTDTTAKFDWTIPTQDPDHGTPVTNFLLEFKEGSNNESTDWNLVTLTGNVSTYTSGAIFKAGHDYTGRITTVGINSQMSAKSSEVTWTQTGSITETQTYDVEDLRNGMDNRFYFREVSTYTTDTQQSLAKCTTHSFSGDSFNTGFGSIASGDFGVCYNAIKSFDTDAIQGNEITWQGSYSRTSGTATYVQSQIRDGCYDVSDGNTYLAYWTFNTYGAGLLYSDDTPSAETFTPDLSSATEPCITYMLRIIDDANATTPPAGGTGGTASGAIERFSINNGTKATTWYVPPSGTMQTNYPHTDYVTGTTFDWGWVDTLFPMYPINDLTGSFTYPNGTLQWSTGETRFGPVTNYRLERQCNTDIDWTVIGSNQFYNPEAEQTGGVVETLNDPNMVHIFQDDWTFTTPADYPFIFDNKTLWVSTDEVAPYFFLVNETSQQFEFDVIGDATDDRIAYDLGAGNLNSTDWVFRNKIYFDEFKIGTSNNHMFWGLSDTLTGNLGTVSQDFLGFRISTGGSDQNVWTTEKDGSTLTYSLLQGFADVSDVTLTDYYMELSRNSTHITGTIYSDPDYSVVVGTGTLAITGTIDNLRYIKATHWNFSSGDQELSGYIDNLYLWNGVSTVPAGMNAVYDEFPYLYCDYRVVEDSDISDSVSCCEETSNTFRLSPLTQGAGGICRDISDNNLVFDWEQDTFSELLYGYGLQISEDDITFINVIENTFTPLFTEHQITGLQDGTNYYIQWRNMFFNGTSGDWSSSTQCTTLQGGGGGSSCTQQQRLDPNSECYIPVEDECTGLTSLDKLGDNIVNAKIGENKNDVFDILWESDENLKFEEFVVDETQGIKIQFQQPIEFINSESGPTRSKIPFTVQIPSIECIDEQTPNCVYNNALYEFPVRTFGESCGDVRWDTTVKVRITDAEQDYRLLLLAIIGFFILIIIIGKRKKKKNKNRHNTLKHKPKPNLG